MNKLFSVFEEKFLPIAGRVGAQRHLVAIRDGFAAILPLIIIGSLAVLINNLPIDFFQDFMNNIFGEDWKNLGGYIWNGTFAVISLVVCLAIAYNLAASYSVDPLAAALVALSSLIIMTPLTNDGGISQDWMSAQGLFVAMLVALIATEIFRKLTQMNLTIRMPEGVPEAVARSFASLIPAVIVLFIFGFIQLVFVDIIGSSLQQLIYDAVQLPFQHIGDTLPAALGLKFTETFLWFFGIHGSNILEPIIEAVYMPGLIENTKLFADGMSAYDVPNIVTKPFLDVFVSMGGTGTGFSMIIAIFIAAKAKALRSVGKISSPAALFNINEPLIFGVPIVLNPALLIPFIIVPLANVVIAYVALDIGLVPKTVVMVPWTTPPIIGGYLVTGGSITGSILQIVNLVVGVFIYLPFIKILDRTMNRG